MSKKKDDKEMVVLQPEPIAPAEEAETATQEMQPEEKVQPKQSLTLDQPIFNRTLIEASNDQPTSLWLITFTDIMALMLTFFVLMYSMATPNEEQWDDIVDSLTRGVSKFYSPPNLSGPQDTIEIDKIDTIQALDLSYLRQIVEKSMRENERLKDLVLITQAESLILSLPQDLLFETGSAEIGVEGKRALFSLGGLMSRIRNRIEIVGHADPTPFSGLNENTFSSNWSLSLARATMVASILKQVGYQREIIVRGASSARYDELPQSLTEAERLSLARRVDIVIMEDTGEQRSFFEFGN